MKTRGLWAKLRKFLHLASSGREYPASYACAHANIYLLYREASKQRDVFRTGRHYCAISDWPEDERDMMYRPESTMEHAYKVALLWHLACMFFPDRFAKVGDELETSLVALLHDAPEGITGNDVADNGCSEHEDAKDAESLAMQRLCSYLPEGYGRRLVRQHEDFESRDAVRDYTMACLKCIDKLEAALGILYQESLGVQGVINALPGHYSDRDAMYAAYLGTDNPVDVWMFGVRVIMDEMDIGQEMTEFVLGVAEVAFMDVRHEVPDCLTASLNVSDDLSYYIDD